MPDDPRPTADLALPLTADEEAELRADLNDHRPDVLALEERQVMRRVLATLDAARAADKDSREDPASTK